MTHIKSYAMNGKDFVFQVIYYITPNVLMTYK